jgi:predicted nucleotidyltransferase
MTSDEFLAGKRTAILAAAARHGARRLRVFGSFARGEGRADSDLDLLVELEPGRHWHDLAHLWDELEALVGRRIDLVEEEALGSGIREHVLGEAVPL